MKSFVFVYQLLDFQNNKIATSYNQKIAVVYKTSFLICNIRDQNFKFVITPNIHLKSHICGPPLYAHISNPSPQRKYMENIHLEHIIINYTVPVVVVA